MKIKVFFLGVIFLIPCLVQAQDGKIISKELFVLQDSIFHRIEMIDSARASQLKNNISFYRLTYFGQWEPKGIANFLGRMASWDYVVIASQYRGVDTGRIGIEGGSRGGMMTYLALKKTCQFKAAVVTAGSADDFKNIASRPNMETDQSLVAVADFISMRLID